MKNANQALMGLAVVGLLGGSVALTTAAPSDEGTILPTPSATDGDSSVVTDPTSTTTSTTTSTALPTTTLPESTTTSLPESTTTIPAGSTTTSTSSSVPDSTTTSTTSTAPTTTLPSVVLSLGDRVWLDINGNGQQDDGATGINGVTVSLVGAGADGTFGTADDTSATTVTAGDGNYEFGNLAPGPYRVVVGGGLPGGLVNSADPDTGQSAPDGRSELALTASLTNQDFGYRPSVVANSSIGDTVYSDVNGNGQQDVGEPGLPGVTVTLMGPGADGVLGTADDTATTDITDDDGTYLFDGLLGGDYKVSVDTATLPAGSINTDDEDGNNNNVTTVLLGDDDDHRTADFGYAPPRASIGDTVYADTNGNGTQDAGEPGIAGQTVVLTLPGGDTRTATTDTNGMYLFTGLTDGTYTVTVVGGIADVATNTGDPDGGAANTSTVTLADSVDDLDQDFGYQPRVELGSIGDTIYLDRNGNGTQDAGELGLPGVTVTLTGPGADGTLGTADDTITTETTDGDGSYLFVDLPAGDYRVLVTGGVPSNLANTGDPDGGADSASLVSLARGEDDLDQDFGYDTENAVLGDRVWWDLDRDGLQDAGEPGINGVEVTARFAGDDGVLGNGDDVLTTSTTSGNGDYLFENIPAGRYTVAVTGGLPGGVVNTFDADSGVVSPDGRSTLTLVAVDLDQDFGYVGTGSIGDAVFLDVDGDGVVDPREGIAGVRVTVTYLGPDGVLGTADDVVFETVTDGNGLYRVGGLPAGGYVVRVDTADLPAGVLASVDPDGGADSVSSLTLAPGESDDDQDFGYVGTGSIGDTVYLDTDGDGIQDVGEPGIAGASVTLTAPGADGVFGTGDDVTQSTTTDVSGEVSVRWVACR